MLPHVLRILLTHLLILLTAPAAAEITFPIDPADNWTIVDKRDNPPTEVISYQPWFGPDLNSYPPGFDFTNYAILREISAAKPVVDERYFRVSQMAPVIDLNANTITRGWDQQELTKDEKLANAEQEEADRWRLISNLPREARDTHIAVGLLISHLFHGYQPTGRTQTFLQDYRATALKLRDNWERWNDIFTAIEAGQYPDLDDWPEPAAQAQSK